MSFGSRSLPPPTPEEWARWQQIKERMVCAATSIIGYVEIHHLLSEGGMRLGHRYTVGLLPRVHAKVKTRAFKAEWPNQKLLDAQDDAIGCARVVCPTRRPKATMTTVREQQEAGGQSRNKAVRGKRRGSRCVTERALPRRYGG